MRWQAPNDSTLSSDLRAREHLSVSLTKVNHVTTKQNRPLLHPLSQRLQCILFTGQHKSSCFWAPFVYPGATIQYLDRDLAIWDWQHRVFYSVPGKMAQVTIHPLATILHFHRLGSQGNCGLYFDGSNNVNTYTQYTIRGHSRNSSGTEEIGWDTKFWLFKSTEDQKLGFRFKWFHQTTGIQLMFREHLIPKANEMK